MKKEKSELEIELEQTIDFLRKRMSEYEFEYNKKLRDIKFLEEENKKLNEKVRFLEECLDDKEKVNKSLREELSKKSMETWFDKKAKNIFIDNSGKVIKGGEFTTLC